MPDYAVGLKDLGTIRAVLHPPGGEYAAGKETGRYRKTGLSPGASRLHEKDGERASRPQYKTSGNRSSRARMFEEIT